MGLDGLIIRKDGPFWIQSPSCFEPQDLAAPLCLIAPLGFSNQRRATLQLDFGIGGVGSLERSSILESYQTPGSKRPTLPTPADRCRMPNPSDLRFGLWFCFLPCSQSFCLGLGPWMGAAFTLGQGRAVDRFVMGRARMHCPNSSRGSFPRRRTGRSPDWFILCIGSPSVPTRSLKTHPTLPNIQRP